MNFELNSDMRVISSPLEIVQYTNYELTVDAPFDDTYTMSMNVIRPDGYKTKEMFLSYVDGIWKGSITPYHTAPIPGNQDEGKIVVSFMVVKASESFTLTSPLVRVRVLRSIEPDVESVPYSFQQQILEQIQNIEAGTISHDRLPLESRFKPNQHPISAITGLKPKVEVHVDEDEPVDQIDTWFEVKGIDTEVPSPTRWELLASTPIIEENTTFATSFNEVHEPKRLVVIGDIQGETYRQEFFADEVGFISGEALLSVDDEFNSVSVNFILQPTSTIQYQTVVFENTGSIDVANFVAFRLEVFR